VTQAEDVHQPAQEEEPTAPSQSGVKPAKPPRLHKPAPQANIGAEEQMAALNERMPNLRHAPIEVQAPQEFPPPPPLGQKAGTIREMMEGEFKTLAALQEIETAATRLGKHVAALKTAITKIADPVEQSVLLIELEFLLSNLAAPLKQTPQWNEAFNTLSRQLHPEVERMMKFKNQTSNFVQYLSNNFSRFPEIAPLALTVQINNITKHEPEAERLELLVHLAQSLSQLAQSDAAREQHFDRLWISTFITTCNLRASLPS
jgi:hypothetical protein